MGPPGRGDGAIYFIIIVNLGKSLRDVFLDMYQKPGSAANSEGDPRPLKKQFQ
jgi:hypothetical protein